MDANDALKSLADLSGQDEEAASKALERLRNASDRSLKSYLYRSVGERYASDFEDIIQEAFIKIWNKRRSFANQGLAAWHRYLQIVTKRCFLDYVLPKSGRVTISCEEIPESELEVVIDFMATINQQNELETIYHAADVLWLGLDGAAPSALHRRQILAAKYFYLDGVPWEEVIDLLGPLSMDDPPLTRPQLEAWLEHEGVIRAMAYDDLFYSKDRLTWYLLGMAEPVQPVTLNALVQQAVAAQSANRSIEDGLTPDIVVILWRYYLAARPDQILKEWRFIQSAEHLSALLDSFALRFPFIKQMTHLLACLEPFFGSCAGGILQTPDLWKRLAFQYYYSEALSLSDIHDRLIPAAHSVSYQLNPGILNGWLSGRRLVEQLARRVANSREVSAHG